MSPKAALLLLVTSAIVRVASGVASPTPKEIMSAKDIPDADPLSQQKQHPDASLQSMDVEPTGYLATRLENPNEDIEEADREVIASAADVSASGASNKTKMYCDATCDCEAFIGACCRSYEQAKNRLESVIKNNGWRHIGLTGYHSWETIKTWSNWFNSCENDPQWAGCYGHMMKNFAGTRMCVHGKCATFSHELDQCDDSGSAPSSPAQASPSSPACSSLQSGDCNQRGDCSWNAAGGQWQYNDKNCWDHNGAVSVGLNNQNQVQGLTIEQCRSLCLETSGCTAVTFTKSGNTCYGRKNVQLSRCRDGGDYYTEVYSGGTGTCEKTASLLMRRHVNDTEGTPDHEEEPKARSMEESLADKRSC